MVPEGWKQVEMREVCEKIAVGLAISVTPYMRESGVKLIRNQNIKRNCFNDTSVVFIDKAFAEKNKNKKVRMSDVVAVRTGSNIGEACVVPKGFDGALTFTTLIARPRREKIDSIYLSTHINSEKGIAEVHRLSAGGGKPNLNSGELKKYRLLLPPLPEQIKIASILSTWDRSITTTEKLLANTHQQKKAFLQQLLTGKKRLLDENGVRFREKWQEYSLGALFSERVDTGKSDLPLLSITAGQGVVYQEETGRKNTSNTDKSKYRRICVNDIGYNTMRMWQGRSSLSDKEGLVSPAYTILIPSDKVVPQYAGYLFKLPQLINVFYRHSQGLVSDTWNLKYNHFKKIDWSFPSKKEQKKIAERIHQADQNIELIEKRLIKLKQEKRALMQQLLSGKRRVKVGEAAV